MAQTVVDALAAAHEVTIVCGRPSYEPTERRAWRLWQTEKASAWWEHGGAKIIRVGSTDYLRAGMGRRVMNYVTYVALSVPRVIFGRCDVVLGMTGPPFEGIVAAFVALLKGKPFVYNIRDLYPDMAGGGADLGGGVVWGGGGGGRTRGAVGAAGGGVVAEESGRVGVGAGGVAGGEAG